jgi:hypothetical protein
MKNLWTFHHVRLKGFGEKFPSEWMLAIDTMESLDEVRKRFDQKIIGEAWKDYIHTTSRKVQRDHFKNSTTFAVVKRAEACGESFLGAACSIHSEMFFHQMRLISEGNTVYIRKCGSYVFDNGTRYEILESKESDVLRFPDSEKTVRFMQWPGGRHWYAKYGEEDVKVDGELKWDTKEQAERAAKKWIEKRK